MAYFSTSAVQTAIVLDLLQFSGVNFKKFNGNIPLTLMSSFQLLLTAIILLILYPPVNYYLHRSYSLGKYLVTTGWKGQMKRYIGKIIPVSFQNFLLQNFC